MEPKTNKLIIYMIKPEFQKPDEIIEFTREGLSIDEVGTFFSEASHLHPPDWISNFFGDVLAQNLGIITSSAKGMLLVPIIYNHTTINFVVSFGFGRHLLKDGVVEERFGLKVVLNSVDPKSLRSIDKTTLGSNPKHAREQISKEGIVADFGIDIEQDLISSVTGKSRYPQLGSMINGSDALGVSIKVDIHTIKNFLGLCLDRYNSQEYLIDFRWIDQIAEVRDPRQIEILNTQLIERLINHNFDKIWMAVPEVVDWVDIQGFRYLKAKRAEIEDDLYINKILSVLESVTLDILKSSYVYVISARIDEIINRWTIYRCLYAEIEHNGKICILNNGKWYEVVKDFVDQVKQDFSEMQESPLAFPDYDHINENEYNREAVASVPNSCCMDRKLIDYGGGYSKIEFCDLFTQDKKIIHIKSYGGSSSLSHLFAQGVVSGELFVSDRNFLRKLNNELPATFRFPRTDIYPKAEEYEVVYGIISKYPTPLNLPFFSKVTLRNARKRLERCGYKVRLNKIKKSEDVSV